MVLGILEEMYTPFFLTVTTVTVTSSQFFTLLLPGPPAPRAVRWPRQRHSAPGMASHHLAQPQHPQRRTCPARNSSWPPCVPPASAQGRSRASTGGMPRGGNK